MFFLLKCFKKQGCTIIKGDTDQVQHPVGVSCEFGNLSERWVFPHQDLVLRVSMSAHLWSKWFHETPQNIHSKYVKFIVLMLLK